MGIFSKIFNSVQELKNNVEDYKTTDNFNNNNYTFNEEEYNMYNNQKIKEFTDKYDLSTQGGIMSIPITEATKYPNVFNISVVYMPEQILNRKATEYKKENNYDLAIACLRKSNELLPYSPFSYVRADYERLVDMLILAKRFDEAKLEHKKLDSKYGTRLNELYKLKEATSNSQEEKLLYQKRVIEPYIKESNDREQYYWLLENMPNIAPKSFGGYRNMKNKNTENYLKIVTELNKINKDINSLKFWY